MSGGKRIVKTYETIDNKKVPVYRIPTGFSGLTPEDKADIEFKVSAKNKTDNKQRKLAKLLDEGDTDSEEVEEYIINEMEPSFEVASLFDNVNVD